MSRIGKLPIAIPKGVEVTIDKDIVKVKGPKGELNRNISPSISIEKVDGMLLLKRKSDSKQDKSLHGLERALINNMIIGVNVGFSKQLILEGVGYKASMEGRSLVLSIGYSHPINYTPPESIKIKTDKNEINIEGIDKCMVGQVAAVIRRFKEPEPYKGKGIRYSNEVIKRKAGKAASTSGGK